MTKSSLFTHTYIYMMDAIRSEKFFPLVRRCVHPTWTMHFVGTDARASRVSRFARIETTSE
jgi:hypothetical protein